MRRELVSLEDTLHRSQAHSRRFSQHSTGPMGFFSKLNASELEHVIRLVGRSPSCYMRRVTLGKLLSVINQHKGKDIRLASALRIFVAPDALRRAVPQEHREAGARLSVGLGAQPRPSQPVTIEPPTLPRVGAPAAPPAAGLAVPNQAMPREAIAADPPGPPRTNAASSKRVRQSGAAANRAHWAADPIAPADANGTAAVTPPVLGAGYAVQVTSERSESRAQAGFRALQARYPNQLGGRQPIIRRADLGAAGTYYRALVGPFASSERAARLCSGLKAAGGDCLIQKN